MGSTLSSFLGSFVFDESESHRSAWRWEDSQAEMAIQLQPCHNAERSRRTRDCPRNYRVRPRPDLRDVLCDTCPNCNRNVAHGGILAQIRQVTDMGASLIAKSLISNGDAFASLCGRRVVGPPGFEPGTVRFLSFCYEPAALSVL